MAPFFIDITRTAFVCDFVSVLGGCAAIGALVGLTLGVGASLNDYEVASARRPLGAAARNVVPPAAICLALSAALATGMFIAAASAVYRGDVTYLEEQCLIGAIELSFPADGELCA